MKQNKSIIDRYFDYMRDSWCEEECRTIFGTRAASVWKVWCRSIAPDLCGAARRFYIALDRGNRRLLIEHIACAVRGQDEECLSKEPSVLVCQECGSREIQMMAWVDPNTLEYVSSIDADADDQWCDACQEHIWFCSLEEFGDNLDAWWLAVRLSPNSSSEQNHMVQVAGSGLPENGTDYGIVCGELSGG